MSTLAGTDAFVVNRGGVNYQVTAANLMSTVLDTDLFVVNRGSVNYKVTGLDVKSYLGGGGGGGGGLFTDSTINIAVGVWDSSDIPSISVYRTGMNAVDPVSGTCITLGSNGIGRSTDFKNWTLVHSFAGAKGGVHQQAVMPLGGGKWFAYMGSTSLTTGVLWRSSVDDGLTWQNAPQISNSQYILGGDGAGNMIFGFTGGSPPRYSTDMGLSSVACTYPDSSNNFSFYGAGAAFDGTATKWVAFSSRSYVFGNQYRILTSSNGITFTTAQNYMGPGGQPYQPGATVVTNWTTPLVTLVIDSKNDADSSLYPLIISYKADTSTVVQKQDLYASSWGGERFIFSAVQPTSDPSGNYVGSITMDTSANFGAQVFMGSGSFGSSLTMYYGGGTINTSGQAAIKDGVIVTNVKATNVSPY
jgi:hypothetical protein